MQINIELFQVAYADTSPYLLTSYASLNQLNSRLQKPAEMRQFRPNITISGCEEPFQEVNLCLLVDILHGQVSIINWLGHIVWEIRPLHFFYVFRPTD